MKPTTFGSIILIFAAMNSYKGKKKVGGNGITFITGAYIMVKLLCHKKIKVYSDFKNIPDQQLHY